MAQHQFDDINRIVEEAVARALRRSLGPSSNAFFNAVASAPPSPSSNTLASAAPSPSSNTLYNAVTSATFGPSSNILYNATASATPSPFSNTLNDGAASVTPIRRNYGSAMQHTTPALNSGTQQCSGGSTESVPSQSSKGKNWIQRRMDISSNSTRQGSILHDLFKVKRSIVIPHSHMTTVPTPTQLSILGGEHLLCDSLTLQKSWCHNDIVKKVREVFPGKLDDKAFELLRSLGKELHPFYPPPGQEVNGQVIFDSNIKILYIRPFENMEISKPLFTKPVVPAVICVSDETDSEEVDEPAAIYVISSSEDELKPPKKLPKCASSISSSKEKTVNHQVPPESRRSFAKDRLDVAAGQGTSSSLSRQGGLDAAAGEGTGSFLLTSGVAYDNSHMQILPESEPAAGRSASNYPASSTTGAAFGEGQSSSSFSASSSVVAIYNAMNKALAAFRVTNKDVNNTKITITPKQEAHDFVRLIDDSVITCSSNLTIAFKNSLAFDLRGGTKEFFSVLFKIFKSDLVEGEHYEKSFKFNFIGCQKKQYFYFGRAVCLSVLNGGPLPDFFSETFWKFLTDVELDIYDLDNVTNAHTKQQLLEAQEASTYAELNLAIAGGSVNGYAFEAIGLGQQCGKAEELIEKKNKAIRSALEYHITWYKNLPMWQQFCDGLGPLYPHILARDELKRVFCGMAPPLTANDLKVFFKCPVTDQEGSRTREMWEEFLARTEGKLTRVNLEDILFFGSSLMTLPEYDSGKLKFQNRSTSPSASTCFNTIYLPLGLPDYNTFQSAFETAVLTNSEGLTLL